MHGIIRHGKLGIVGLLWVSLLLMGATVVNSQHDHSMHKAPAAKKPARKRAPRRKPRRRTARKPAAPKASPSPTPHQHTPGMPMPAASPAASPHQHTPGMPMPAASPAASPHQHTPGMPMPQPSPGSSPHMHTPVPGASPSASPAGHAPGMHASGMNMGPLLVMDGDHMGIRVGSSDKNVMSMGAMGSGSAWQPSSGPMFMHHWNKSDWLLMLHYNAFVSVNAQGGPRGVTKFESANWFMPMAFRKLGRGTLQL